MTDQWTGHRHEQELRELDRQYREMEKRLPTNEDFAASPEKLRETIQILEETSAILARMDWLLGVAVVIDGGKK